MRQKNSVVRALSIGVLFSLASSFVAPLSAAEPCLSGESAATPELQVRTLETLMSSAMARRALETFADCLDDATVMADGTTVLRGKEAVLRYWSPLFLDPIAPLLWRVERAESLAQGDLVATSGPIRDPSGATVAVFHAIWQWRNERWRLIYQQRTPQTSNLIKPVAPTKPVPPPLPPQRPWVENF